MATHSNRNSRGNLMRVTETAHWLEWRDWGYPILREPFPLKNGAIEIPDRPGNGIEWDEAAIRKYGY